MAINFPDSPTVGQVFTASGRTWIWTGSVWSNDATAEYASVQFDTAAGVTAGIGELAWDAGEETLNIGLTSDVTLQVGQEVLALVFNAESTTLNPGEIVYLFGAQGDKASVKRASNASEGTSTKTLGMVTEAIPASQVGYVTTQGVVNGLNTAAYNPGDVLWLGSTAGTYTTTKPVAPAHTVFIGIVERANSGDGKIYVKPQNGYELDELHDVLISSPSTGQILTYDATAGLWKNQAAPASGLNDFLLMGA